MQTVSITEAPMSLEELLAVVAGAPLELGAAARSRIAQSREVLGRALEAGGPIYGVSTQVGHGKDTRIVAEQLAQQQRFLVMSHAGQFGPPLPTDIVRAAMVVRVNGIARGGSGASPAAAETLVAMLNAGVHPVLSGTGSVGAGDLGPMAMVAQVAIGEGRAEFRGEVLGGAEALRAAGIEALRLEGKDGLALISANGVSIGQAALVLARAAEAAAAADIAAAVSIEATEGNPSIALPAAARAKPFPGQIAAAEHLLDLLQGSRLLEPGAPRSVQDALSFRVVPQVHGTLREFIATARQAVETELNSASDNPLVDTESGQVISNGNFHPLVMAVAFDALRIALVHVGQLSERRMGHLWNAAMAALQQGGGPLAGGPPEGGPPEGGPPAGETAAGGPPVGEVPAGGPPANPGAMAGLQLRYPASAAFTELRLLAGPATLDSTVLDLGIEDHATGAPLTVRKTDEALGLLGDLLAIELLLAGDVLAMKPPAALGAGSAAALRLIREAADDVGPGTADQVHRRLRQSFPAPPQMVDPAVRVAGSGLPG